MTAQRSFSGDTRGPLSRPFLFAEDVAIPEEELILVLQAAISSKDPLQQ